LTEMATISLSGFSHKSGVAEVPSRHPAAAVARAKLAKAANHPKRSAAGTKDVRRALPPRVVE